MKLNKENDVSNCSTNISLFYLNTLQTSSKSKYLKIEHTEEKKTLKTERQTITHILHITYAS